MKERIFFPGLNELRAFAALAVVLHHIELYKSRLQISLRKFYARRILRIWPLYYIIIFLSFFAVPYLATLDFFRHEYYYNQLISSLQLGTNFILFLFFLSNIALLLFSPVAGASHTWSVSVEEQFYGFWPLMMNLFRRRAWIPFSCIIILKPLITYGLAWGNNHYFHYEAVDTLVKFLETFAIELMAIGGVGAWLLFNFRQRMENFFSKREVFVAVLVLLIVQLVRFSYLLPLGVTFLGLILCCICFKINFRPFNFLGKISYGIYMYHPMVMYTCFALVNNYAGTNGVWYNVAVYILIPGCTIALSYLSFEYIEKRFLTLKKKVSTVLSGKE
jgi:peptidoglycan/LPS O-acetylase OafA/YrhL